jgi:RimJ/RimL family protein N-acetyltransferase
MQSNRIKLINCNEQILNNILSGDEAIAKALGLNVPKKWTEFGEVIFQFALDEIKVDPASKKWWAYLPVLIKTNTLIGSCGYKGKPDENGYVEIGYEVAEDYRNRGYATEITKTLINIALTHPEVKGVLAHTLANENPSTCVLKKCNFKKTDELEDEEDGKIWRWELMK